MENEEGYISIDKLLKMEGKKTRKQMQTQADHFQLNLVTNLRDGGVEAHKEKLREYPHFKQWCYKFLNVFSEEREAVE